MHLLIRKRVVPGSWGEDDGRMSTPSWEAGDGMVGCRRRNCCGGGLYMEYGSPQVTVFTPLFCSEYPMLGKLFGTSLEALLSRRALYLG